jgi:hypothetical protein
MDWRNSTAKRTISMVDVAFAGNVSPDGHVVGWIRKYDAGLRAAHQGFTTGRITCAAA